MSHPSTSSSAEKARTMLWGGELSQEKRTCTFKPQGERKECCRLLLTAICLGEKAKEEVNRVEILPSTSQEDKRAQPVTIASLKASVLPMVSLSFRDQGSCCHCTSRSCGAWMQTWGLHTPVLHLCCGASTALATACHPVPAVPSQSRVTMTGVELSPPVTFQLRAGSGPVFLSGQECYEISDLPWEEEEEGEEEEEEEDDDDDDEEDEAEVSLEESPVKQVKRPASQKKMSVAKKKKLEKEEEEEAMRFSPQDKSLGKKAKSTPRPKKACKK